MKQLTEKQNYQNAVCFWSWNDRLEIPELLRQLREFADRRFAGVIIHSRGGLRIPYMGEEWFSCWAAVLSECERLGLDVWIYDEDGWPSGFAGGRVNALGEEHQMKWLEFSEAPDGRTEQFVAAWRSSNGGYVRILESEVKSGDLVCRYAVDANYVDLLSRDTVRCFIDATHEQYKARFSGYFGNVIKGTFTDEPQFSELVWSDALSEEWHRRFGSDLRDFLYMLVKPAGDYKNFRLQYRRLAGELFYRSFTAQIAEWCAANGLALTGHFGAEDGLCGQVSSNGGVMRQYAAMQVPGIDHLGNRNTSPVLEKQAASVANQLGKADVLSETFGCAGWHLTFSDIDWLWGRQSALGVTLPCFHLSAYSMAGRRKRDYPAFFSYQEPWWEQFPEMMRRVNGLNAYMREGAREADTLVISPLDSVAANFSSAADDAAAQHISSSFRVLLESLLDLQLDFELGDEQILSESADVTEDGALRVGQCRYHTVIVPYCETLRPSTARLLREYADRGGRPVYMTAKPQLSNFKPYKFPDGPVIQNRRDTIDKYLLADGVRRTVTLYSTCDRAQKHNAVIHTRSIGDTKRFHIWTDEDFCSGDTAVAVVTDCDSVYQIDYGRHTETRLAAERVGDVLWFTVPLKNRANAVFEVRHGGAQAALKPDITGVERIGACEIRLSEPNALNLDYNEIKIKNGAASGYGYTVHNTEWLYRELQKLPPGTETEIGVHYRFRCGDGLDLNGLTLVLEDEYVESVRINGKPLPAGRRGWWIDRSFGEFSLQGLVQSGLNAVELSYKVLPASLLAEGFENERNRFFYPVEPESIYLRGNFDVTPLGEAECGADHYSVAGEGFVLTAPTGKTMGCLTRQGCWFYRGNAEYAFTVRKPEKARCFLAVHNGRATGAVIAANGGSEAMLSLDGCTEITGLLKDGCNRVTLTLLGHNRNLCGPHHHKNGVTKMVGPSTFMGKSGFEDFVNHNITGESTWTDSYSFIPFGADDFKLIFTR